MSEMFYVLARTPISLAAIEVVTLIVALSLCLVFRTSRM